MRTLYVYVTDTVFQENHWRNGYGGAIFSNYFVELKLQGCHFINNSARSGGAIFNIRSTLHVNDTVFEHNVAEVYGGAISSYEIYIKPTSTEIQLERVVQCFL